MERSLCSPKEQLARYRLILRRQQLGRLRTDLRQTLISRLYGSKDNRPQFKAIQERQTEEEIVEHSRQHKQSVQLESAPSEAVKIKDISDLLPRLILCWVSYTNQQINAEEMCSYLTLQNFQKLINAYQHPASNVKSLRINILRFLAESFPEAVQKHAQRDQCHRLIGIIQQAKGIFLSVAALQQHRVGGDKGCYISQDSREQNSCFGPPSQGQALNSHVQQSYTCLNLYLSNKNSKRNFGRDSQSTEWQDSQYLNCLVSTILGRPNHSFPDQLLLHLQISNFKQLLSSYILSNLVNTERAENNGEGNHGNLCAMTDSRLWRTLLYFYRNWLQHDCFRNQRYLKKLVEAASLLVMVSKQDLMCSGCLWPTHICHFLGVAKALLEAVINEVLTKSANIGFVWSVLQFAYTMIPIAASYLREETKFTTIVCDLLDEGQDESLQLYSLLLLEKMREHGECIDTEWLTLKYLALDNNQTDVSRYYWLYIACACENFGQKLQIEQLIKQG